MPHNTSRWDAGCSALPGGALIAAWGALVAGNFLFRDGCNCAAYRLGSDIGLYYFFCLYALLSSIEISGFPYNIT